MTKLTDDQMRKLIELVTRYYKELDERLLAFAFIASEDFDAYVEAFKEDAKRGPGRLWETSNRVIRPKLELWMGVWMGVWIALTSVLEIYE